MTGRKCIAFFLAACTAILGSQGLLVKRGSYIQIIPEYIQPLMFYADSVLECHSSCKDNPACLYFTYTDKLCQFYYGTLIRNLTLNYPGFSASNVDVRDCPYSTPFGVFNCSLHEATNTCFCYAKGAASRKWADAYSFCTLYGMKFAVVDTKPKFDLVTDLLTTLNVSTAWTSGIQQTDPVTEASIGYRWNSTKQDIHFSNIGRWCSTQPDNSGSCIQIMKEGDAYCWDDLDCVKDVRPLCHFQLYGH